MKKIFLLTFLSVLISIESSKATLPEAEDLLSNYTGVFSRNIYDQSEIVLENRTESQIDLGRLDHGRRQCQSSL